MAELATVADHGACAVDAADGWRVAESLAARFLLGHEGRTRSGYASDLRQFARWCSAQDLLPLQVSRADLELYLSNLRQQGLARATIARRCTTLHGYFAYALDEGVVEANPMVRVRRPRVPKDSPDTGLTKAETLQLLAAAEDAGPRLHTLVSLLVLTGLRVSEALACDVEDLQLHSGHQALHVVRKGGARNVVALPAPLVEQIRDYLGSRTTGPLFVTRTGRRWDRHAVWKELNALSRRCFPQRRQPVHPHTLRAVNITLALAAGVPLHRVQQAAGHADPRMTMRYWRAAQELDDHSNYAVATYLTG